MRHYEIVALVHPDQSAQIEEIVARYRKIVEDSGGKVHRQENWGRRKLAYPIKKIYKADYFLLNVECDPSVKDKIENDFKYYDSILRSLCIRQDKAITEQSAIMKKLLKQEEEERQAKEREAAEMERLRVEESAKAAKAAAEAEKESAAEAAEMERLRVEESAKAAKAAAEAEKESAAEAENDSAEEDDVVDESQSEANGAEEKQAESETESEEKEATV